MILNTPDLVAAIADGRFHSGSELGLLFGVTKAAIWKAIKKVAELGLEVHSVRGKGYRLSEPLTLLDAKVISSQLSLANQRGLHQLELVSQVDSTNSHALRRHQSGSLSLPSGAAYVCLAEMQTSGKGRRGREWISPFGHNMYLTLMQEFSLGVAGLEGLSLAVGVALIQALQEWGFTGLGLKWPNDVLWQNKKVAGILIEINGDVAGNCHVVIGLGMNLKHHGNAMDMVTQPWTTLGNMGFAQHERNCLFGRILDRQLNALEKFRSVGFAAFLQDWHALDVTAGVDIEISSASGVITGRSLGVDASGALLLQTANGIQAFHGGEVSLRARAVQDLE